jgi:hypothetical protein
LARELVPMLLGLDEIQRKLDVVAARDGFSLEDLRLRGPGLREADIESIENTLRCRLPASYRKMASLLNFENLTLGAVQFGSGRLPQADELIAQNIDDSWWGRGDRPADLVSIGGGDPDVILLRLSDGAILAFDSESNWRNARVVASDIELFLKGLGTAYLASLEKRTETIEPEMLNQSVGGDSSEFWRVAVGRAP